MTEALDPASPSAAWTAVEIDDELRERRTNRLLSGLQTISQRTRGIDGERLLFLLGAVAIPLGVVLVCIGWYGSAGSGLVFEQVPYMVSGGMGGLGLIVIGCTLYGCWWITRAIRDQRERHDALMLQNEELLHAVHDLTDEVARMRATPAPATKKR